MSPIKTGARLRCEECKSEVIALTAADAELTCCGAPMVAAGPGAPKR